jgi:hypothetical protein
MEGDILAMALWYVIGAAFLVLGSLGFGLMALRGGAVGMVFGVIGGTVLLALAGGSYFVGQGLRQWAQWARWAALGLTALGLLAQLKAVLGNPIGGLLGIALGGYQAYVLYQAESLFTPEYRDMVNNSGEAPNPYRSIFFWAPLVLCVLAIGMMLVTGAFLALATHHG